MEEIKEERTVLITLEIPADVIGLKVIRRDTEGYGLEEHVCLGMLRDVIRPEEGYEERAQA